MIGACLKIRRSPTARNFGGGQDGEFRAFEVVPERGVGHNAPAGGPASRPSSMRKKTEQPWEYARKGGTLGGTESVLFRLFTAFYGFLRLTAGKKVQFSGAPALILAFTHRR